MMEAPHTPPSQGEQAFNCPLCNAFSHQDWMTPTRSFQNVGNFGKDDAFQVCRCEHCGGFSIWYSGIMLHPEGGSAPLPSPDLPQDLRGDYEEARAIADRSARGSAALLRLVIQKLCRHLGKPGKNINDDIAALVKDGLPVTVQKALDVVRVVGNNSVHPGEMNLNDDPKAVHQLFRLVNLIVQIMITQPKQVAALYDELPDSARNQVEKRDGS